MVLLPRMLQSIEVLQLPSVELETFLTRAAAENEALLVEPPTAGEGDGAWAQSAPRHAGGRIASGEATDRHAAWLESQPDRTAGLEESLLEQLALADVAPALVPWVRLVIRSLDANGYLSIEDDALLAAAAADALDGGATELGRAIAVVQGLEPRGVGGRDAVEALLLQLDPEDVDYALLCRVLEEFLDEVVRNKLPHVARAMGIDLERLQGLLGRLRGLSLAPGQGLSGDTPPALRPDLVVREEGGGFTIEVLQSGLPAVSIDEEVRVLAGDRNLDGEVRGYLRDKLERARWLVNALEERKRTLLRIATVVFDHQRAFLEHGAGHLRPLRMGQVAETLGIHLSTVSRGVAGKHVDTPWGLFALRHFFQGEAGGSQASVTSDVRSVVREVVDAEDPQAPLSDDEIAAALQTRGFEVARRTVAKYRRELDIPSSYRRRRYAE